MSKEEFAVHNLHPDYLAHIERYFRPLRLFQRADILVVVDTEIATQPGVGFGVGSVIELIRQTTVGCLRFRVDIALRNGESPHVVNSPAPYAPNYRGFRFDMVADGDSVIDKYEQIWCFGFKPSNSGSNNDAEIDQPSSFPASDAELAKLSQWMDDRKGGLFGTGDHHFLGASMCRQIPRLGTMRRWTNADGVPPIGTPDRIDTLRPPSSAYMPGAPGGPLALGNGPHQGDLEPQPIRWATWQSVFWPFLYRRRPHPVLCHPTLGPIDVMPDHAHEGLCVPVSEINLGATYDFGQGSHPEYPDAVGAGPKPTPFIAAYGSTLGDPPYNFQKGPQPARSSFPMISVYDGHKAGVGRVATDSTWHHWMDVNIGQMQTADNSDWKKIERYFINLAVWLCPPGYSTRCWFACCLLSHFQYAGFQEYHRELPVQELGAALRQQLILGFGPCWVSQFIWDYILFERRLWPWEILQRQVKDPLGGLDLERIENHVLGAMTQVGFEHAERIRKAVSYGKDTDGGIDNDELESLFDGAIKGALQEAVEIMSKHCSELEETIGALRR